MHRSLAFIACVAALATAPAMAANRTFPVPGFDKLRVDGPYTVHVHTGAHAGVSAHGPQRKLDKLVVEARSGTVVISTEKSMFGMNWGDNGEVVVDVTLPMLDVLTLDGSGDIDVDRVKTPAFASTLVGSGDIVVRQLDTDRLTAIVTGSGDMTLTGHAARADMAVRGSGDLHADGIAADLLSATVTGSGDLNAGPARQANVTLTGSGDVTVRGHPHCVISKHGSGDVTCGE